MSVDSTEINLLLDQYRDGQTEGFEKLMALVYDDLRKLAAWHLQSERPDHTFGAGARSLFEAGRAKSNRLAKQGALLRAGRASHATHPG